MKRFVVLLALSGCFAQPPPIRPACQPKIVYTTTAGPSLCPGMNWAECAEWAFDRSLVYEEKLRHAEIELELQDKRLAIQTSTAVAQPEVSSSPDWWWWILMVPAGLAGVGIWEMVR